MKHIFIINPAAGKYDRTEEFSGKIAAACASRGLDYAIHVSEKPGDCRDAARRAAESGDTSAQKILGALYLSGHEDIAKDTLKARYWLQKAADQDDSDALELLKQIN